MKRCNSCKEIKEQTEFHKCSSVADGLQHQCKSCRKSYQSAYRKTEKGRARDARYNSSLKARENYKKYKDKHPKIKTAHQVIKNEIRSGRLLKQSCESCGAKVAQCHHDNYDNPLDIRWLCDSCHRVWHKENGLGLNAE